MHDDAAFAQIDDIRRDLSSLGERMSSAETTIERVNGDLYNHGKDGLKTQFTAFVADYHAREDERSKTDKRRLAIIVGILVPLLIGLIGLEVNRQVHSGDLQMPTFHATSNQNAVYAGASVQDAGMPEEFVRK